VFGLDPQGLIEVWLGGNSIRSIDTDEHDAIGEEGIRSLVRAAVSRKVPSAGH
jgi:hypothetical protein